MAQTTLLNTTFTMLKTIARRRPFILLAIFFLLVILTVIINSNNGSHTVISNYYKHYSKIEKYQDDPNDEFLKITPNFHFQDDGSAESLKRLENSLNAPKSDKSSKIGYVPERRIIHLDLKGAAPKVSYFEALFSIISKSGATGVMIEWEDMFPFENELEFAKHQFAYSKSEIQIILQTADRMGLEVIPLIQSFGHLEYFLKLQKYRSLRELDVFPQAICPSNIESLKLIQNIIDQVLALHKNAKFIHIGCDEVFQLGACEKCRLFNRDELFLNHVLKVAKYVSDKYKIGSIMWDDMLRQFPEEVIKKYDFEKVHLEIMIWTYVDDIYRFISEETWYIYSHYIPNIWGASAYKGAFGETLITPNAKMHLDNNIAWLEAMKEQSKRTKIRGLVITGWQRYDHLANLCELIPAGIPSMIIDLLTITNGYYEDKLFEKFDRILNCDKRYEIGNFNLDLIKRDPYLSVTCYCQFPGYEVFKIMKEVKDIIKRVDEYLYDKTVHKAWLTDYNDAHNITNPMRIQEALQDYFQLMQELKAIIARTYNALNIVFEEYTSLEWIEQKLYPAVTRMEKFYNRTKRLKKLRTWPRRPIQPIADLKRLIPNKNSLTNNEKK